MYSIGPSICSRDQKGGEEGPTMIKKQARVCIDRLLDASTLSEIKLSTTLHTKVTLTLRVCHEEFKRHTPC